MYFVYKYFPYYCIGALVGEILRQRICIKGRYLYIITFLCAVLLLMGTAIWYRLPSKVPEGVPLFVQYFNNSELCHFIISLSGSLFFILVFAKFINTPNSLGLTVLGRNTLGIYAVHIMIILILKQTKSIENYTTTYMGFFCCFFIVLFSSIAILKLIKSNSYLNLFLLGVTNRKNND